MSSAQNTQYWVSSERATVRRFRMAGSLRWLLVLLRVPPEDAYSVQRHGDSVGAVGPVEAEILLLLQALADRLDDDRRDLAADQRHRHLHVEVDRLPRLAAAGADRRGALQRHR